MQLAILRRVCLPDAKIILYYQENKGLGTESSKVYAITPTTYTNKAGKTTPMHSIQFSTLPSYEQSKALAAFTHENADGRKSRGWCKKEQQLERAEQDEMASKWEEPKRVLMDTKKASEGKTIAPEDSLSHAEAPRYVPSLPKIRDVKLATISENLKLLKENIHQQGLGKNYIIFEIAQSIRLNDKDLFYILFKS